MLESARLKNLVAQIILAPIVWALTYAVCAYPVAYANGILWAYTLRVEMPYMVYEHPEDPFLTAIATTTVLLNMGLATSVTFKIHRRIWPKTSN
jgi:uncharacterized membrane protein